MTTYTKTELIDMVIDKLGENPDWGNNTHVIHCISDTNSHYGCIRLFQVRADIEELNTAAGWRYICTRQEFEQRVAERKALNSTPKWWDYENDQMLCNHPVGTHCEFTWGQHSDWFESVILPNDCVAYKWYGEWRVIQVVTKNKATFRPLNYKPKLTERQQAGLKLWRAINWRETNIIDENVINKERFEDYCRPFDQGLLK